MRPAPDPLAESTWLAALSQPDSRLDFALFGYDTVVPDWGFRQRVLPDHLIYLVVDGSCTGDIDGAPFALSAGSLLWMQPGVRHTFEVGPGPRPPTLYFARFRLSVAGRELALADRPFQHWEAAWELRELMDQLVDELGTQLAHREPRLRGLLLAICAATLRHREPQAAKTGAGTLSRAQRQAIESYVRQHLSARLTPRDLAEHVQLSHDYFSRRFAVTFGMPPRTWLVHTRLRGAARRLTDSMQSISQIAAALGYEDVSAFSHQFRQRYGLSPRAYRQQQR